MSSWRVLLRACLICIGGFSAVFITSGCGSSQNKVGQAASSPASAVTFDQFIHACNAADLSRVKEGLAAHPEWATKKWGQDTAIHFAGSAAVVDALVNAGADVNAVGLAERRPLHTAAASGNSSVVRCLIQHGADVNATMALGATPLHGAANKEIAAILVESGASLKPDAFGNLTVLDRQALSGHADVVEYLLLHNESPNETCFGNLVPLHFASTAQVVELLVSHGANVNQVSADDKTPLDAAIASQRAEVIEALQRHGGVRAAQASTMKGNR